MIKGVSLFTSAGIAETYLNEVGVEITVANELIKERATLYANLYKNSKMIAGDILDKNNFAQILEVSGKKVDFLIASPPCQGLSVAGKNRTMDKMVNDERNHLVFKIIEFIFDKKPNFILIENVPNFLRLQLPYQGKLHELIDLFSILFKDIYNFESDVFDAADYGVPQRRNRAIIKMFRKGLKWGYPSKEKIITVENTIGHLPSLEAGQKSNVAWHFARNHADKHILWMKNTPTGKSAFENKKYTPVKENGEKIKSYMTTYRRMKWEEPAPTITMRNDAISSQLNVHPGRLLRDGTYSDARVLTPLELMLLSSLPHNWNIPVDTSEILIRKCIGECIPPLMIKKIVAQINN